MRDNGYMCPVRHRTSAADHTTHKHRPAYAIVQLPVNMARSLAEHASEPTHARIAPQTAVWPQNTHPRNIQQACLMVCAKTRLAHDTKADWQGDVWRAPGAVSSQQPRRHSKEMTSECSRPASPVRVPGSAQAMRSMEGHWHRYGSIDTGTCSRHDVAKSPAASPQP